MSITERYQDLYGGATDNDLVMESIGRTPFTDTVLIMGGKAVALSLESAMRTFTPSADIVPLPAPAAATASELPSVDRIAS